MKKARLIAGVTAAIPAAGALAIPAAAHATQATTAAHQVKGKTVLRPGVPLATGPGWYSLSEPETLYYRSGRTTTLGDGVRVDVTCYYLGAPGSDPYWDHVINEYIPGAHRFLSITGHLADRHVKLPNHEYPPAAGIPHC